MPWIVDAVVGRVQKAGGAITDYLVTNQGTFEGWISSQHWVTDDRSTESFLDDVDLVENVLEWTTEQRVRMPYRDSYQVGLYMTIIAAVAGFSRAELMAFEHEHAGLFSPRVFEVGRTGPIELTPLGSFEADEGRILGMLSAFSTPTSLGNILSLGLLLALFVMLMFPFVPALRRMFVGTELNNGGIQLRIPSWDVFLMVVFTASLFVLLVNVALWDHRRMGGEPFYFLEGISTWPTAFVLLGSSVLGLWFIALVFRTFEESRARLWKEFAQESRPKRIMDEFHSVEGTGFRKFWQRTTRWLARIAVFTMIEGTSGQNTVKVLSAYERKSRLAYQAWRIGIPAAIFIAFGHVLVGSFGGLGDPSRSALSSDVGRFLFYTSGITFIVLLFAVADLTRLCDRLLRCVGNSLRTADASECSQSIRAIGRHSEDVERTMYFPGVLLFLLILSRSSLFDAWRWPIALIIMSSVCGVILIWGTLLMRRSARATMRSAVRRVRDLRHEAVGDESKIEDLSHYLEEIRGEHRGAFRPFLQTPLVRFLLLPFAGLGSLPLIERLASSAQSLV